MRKFIFSLAAALVLIPTAVFAQTTSEVKNQKTAYTANNMSEMDIVDTAVSAKMFSTLVAAVQAAGLVETLKGEGPFTVLAPTDDAFKKLPAGTVENLLKPENKDMLIKILTYHVIPGEVKAAQVVTLNKAKTVQGQDIKIKTKNGKVMINKANVIKTDVDASNGVIHVIDTVLMPK